MTLERKVLLENLKLAMPGIESGNVVLQGSDSFVFHNGKLFTYNDLVAVLVPIDSIGLVDDDIEGAVHAKEFYNVVSKFTNDEITLSVKDDHTWELKCGRAKASLTLLDFDFKTRLDGVSPDDNAWVDLDNDFIDGVAICKMGNNKSNLSGIYVNDKNILSTDSYQINLYTMKNSLPKFWISDSSVNELLKIKNFKKVQVSKTWVHFKTEDGVVFSLKTLNDVNYPYTKIMNLVNNSNPSENDFHATFPSSLFKSVDIADSFAISMVDQSVVRLVLSNEGIEVSSEKNSGSYLEMIPWDKPLEKEIEPTKLYVNPSMMSAMGTRSLEFYLIHLLAKNGKIMPRILFVTESSKHIMAAFNEPSTKENKEEK